MNSLHKARGSADKDTWRTPAWLIKAVQSVWPIEYDITAGLHGENCAEGLKAFPDDALQGAWEYFKVFANPPFDSYSLLKYAERFSCTPWLPGNGGILLCP